MYYYPLQPPYILLLIGFLTALTSGLALSGTLKVIIQQWPKDKSKDKSSEQNTNARFFYKQLLVPFIGITGGICLFLSSGLEIFGFPFGLALGVGLPMSLLTCLFVWWQLGGLLDYVKSQGMQSLDLDSWS
ncbi:hypothetical protein H6G54_01825 [Anabaena cylindrica FACHB-243]|uniref:Uncharacterized protein n=1 Tax=Anabaena cylindrica (strain ATCC 27899 / PCC 7122) TaxID=272123 RepID=K9ZHX7_ANACC|nr:MULTISPECIES: hypothetical protein [Anabaena]AFZ58833.1 hypothetical protein Anacy_3433 [Anabaena cylindrica PCC 7122]MBD2416469.1 hypothetical protein [Anabaena cylindrica FACHB-243]MBY5282569.1 hypothetical protein [Anabaena sp. CCAP 1446/1C]MBY5307289.1 hypothetical protein [Anabaena sp. CCAP 1446/1C]MCM2409458.1 hypothetical protein [Anabaena sp. CCAP 1446/1C]